MRIDHYEIGDGKYVAFKLEDFYEMMGQLALPPAWGSDESGAVIGGNLDCAVLAERITEVAKMYEVPDGTVLRAQDIFTAPALFSYVNAIRVALELLGATHKGLRTQEVERLEELADFFFGRAVMAQESTVKKIPD